MAVAKQLHVDIAIIGGGVAGLWLLARLRQVGYQAILLESEALGAGQTRFAQGIIHGGTKYALTGKLTASSEAIASMPQVWRDCQQGQGEVDLTAARLLSEHQYLWSTASLTSRMAGFFASQVMRSRTQAIEKSQRPAAFRNPAFHGQVYRLDEPVFDTLSVIRALAGPHQAAIMHTAGDMQVQTAPQPSLQVQSVDGQRWSITAQKVVLAAGKGNRACLQAAGLRLPEMQLRPLQMVMVRGNLPDRLYAHCLGASVNPRITITSHEDSQGQLVWYMGGQLAEDGVRRSVSDQIGAAKQELSSLMPWLDMKQLEWATLFVDRAEPKMAGGKRPDRAFFQQQDGIITTWPTKMALSPLLANELMQLLDKEKLPKSGQAPLPDCPRPPFANLPWQEEERWS